MGHSNHLELMGISKFTVFELTRFYCTYIIDVLNKQKNSVKTSGNNQEIRNYIGLFVSSITCIQQNLSDPNTLRNGAKPPNLFGFVRLKTMKKQLGIIIKFSVDGLAYRGVRIQGFTVPLI